MNFFIIYLKYISDHTNNARPKQSTQIMIQGHLFNVEMDTKYSKCKKVNASGGKSVGIYNSQTGQPLYVETPILMTWGLQQYTDDKTGKVSYEFSLQFPNNDDFNDTEDTRAFLQSMIAFERKLKADALTNSNEWFEKPNMTPDAVKAMFNPILKYPKDKVTCEKDMSKKPTMRIKVPLCQGKWEGVEIYDADRKRLFPSSDPNVSPIDIITKLSHMKTMIQCGGIWFANGKFGVTWRFIQGKMDRVDYRRRDYYIYKKIANIEGAKVEAFAAKAEAFASMAEAIEKRRPACEWFERISVVAGQATTEASTHYPKMMRP